MSVLILLIAPALYLMFAFLGNFLDCTFTLDGSRKLMMKKFMSSFLVTTVVFTIIYLIVLAILSDIMVHRKTGRTMTCMSHALVQSDKVS